MITASQNIAKQLASFLTIAALCLPVSMVALPASMMVLAASVASAKAEYKLSILHFNDQHSRIEPINKYNSTCPAVEEQEGKCFGGIARMKTAIEERRTAQTKNGSNVLVLDAGDEFQGSLFYSTYKGKAIAEFLNQMGLDAMTIGNHEFDDGPKVLSNFISAANFPIVSGNASLFFEPDLKGKVAPYLVVEKGGEKIAIIGLIATDTKILSSPGDNVAFIDEIDYLKTVLPEIKAKGVNKIIALTHVGFNRDKEIAAQVNDIDVIVGGHSNTLLSNSAEDAQAPYPVLIKNPDGDQVAVVQAGAYSKYLGELNITFDDNGKITSTSGDTLLLDAKYKPDAEMTARIKELAGPIEELKKKRIGATALPIDGKRENCRYKECTMGNLVADAMLARMKDQGISLAIQNGGGLRASIDAGDITMGEVLTVLPFQNTLATFQLSGEDIISALENGVSEVEDGGGRFPQVSGLRFFWNPKGEPNKNRILSVEIADGDDWKPIDNSASYGVVTNDFVRKGGDGYSVFKTNAQNVYDYGPGLEEVVADYLTQHSPYVPKLKHRIFVCEQTDNAGKPAQSCLSAAGITTNEGATNEAKPAEAPPETPVESPSDSESVETLQENKEPEGTSETPTKPQETAEPVDNKIDEDKTAEKLSEPAVAESGENENENDSNNSETANQLAEQVTEEATEENTEQVTGQNTEQTASPDKDQTKAPQALDAGEETAAAQEEKAEEPTEKLEKIPRGRYVVREGDTYWNIAERAYGNGSKWKRIRRANRRTQRRNALKVGSTIRIP